MIATPPEVIAPPQICVGAVVVRNEQLLLVRRGHPPEQGRWSVPGGRVGPGEMLAEAVVRELAEETGLEGICGPLVGWTERIEPDAHYVILDFEVTLLDDARPTAGSDADEVAWVTLGDVAEMQLVEGLAEFLHEHGIIRTIV